MITNKKILVSGGAGFLGSNLCKKLLTFGGRVIAVDDLSTGSHSNIKDLLANKNFEFIEHDIVLPLYIEDVDYIFNLACPASPPRYQADPIRTTKISVLGSINMLELARSTGAKILQASTSEVYGDPKEHPQREDYRGNVNPIGVRACYDEGKRCAESLFFDYNRMYRVNTKVVRIFNTYGPNMDPCDGRVVSNFIVSALSRKPLEIYGDGLQTRSFCYVDDMINGLIAMMMTKDDVHGPINLGNPNEFSINELADLVIRITNSFVGLRLCCLPKDDPLRRKPDISLAKEVLNWQPKIELEEGLSSTIRYFCRILKVEEFNK